MTTCYSFRTPQYTPAIRIINAITNDLNAQVTTTIDHLYLDGLKVRIDIPKFHGKELFGMQQMDGLIGTITIIDEKNFTIDINSSQFDPFSVSVLVPSAFTCPQVVPIAEISENLNQAVANTSGKRQNII